MTSIVYGNLVIRSWDSPAQTATVDVRRPAVGQGFEGIHVFDISNPAQPLMVKQFRFAARQPGPRRLRLAHRDRRAGSRA